MHELGVARQHSSRTPRRGRRSARPRRPRRAGSAGRSRRRCARRARSAARTVVGVDPVDRAQRRVQRSRAPRWRRQTSVPSMSNSSSTRRSLSAANDMSGSSRWANAAISRAAASMSSSDDHLDRRVHVAQRHRDEAGGDARAAEVDRVGVGAGAAAERLDRERDLLVPPPPRAAARRPAGGAVVPRAITGPEPSVCLVISPELDPRLVGGERDVDDDRHVGLVRERAGPRAREGRLLLGHRQRDHVPGAPPRFGHQPRRLGGDVAADAVVERAGDDAAVAQLDGRDVDHRHVADPHQLARLVAVARRRCRCGGP